MQQSEWNPAELLKMSGSYWETCALHAGVKLQLFAPLAARPQSAAELAAELGVAARGLGMLLDALAAMRLLEKQGEQYTATGFAADFLDHNAPQYLGHIIMHHHHLVDSWRRLDEAVRDGGPVRNRVSHEPTAAERESFLLGMFNLAMLIAPKVAAQVDLAGCRRLLDLGGGPGTYAIHFCRENPELAATVYDLPTTRPFAEKTIARFSLSDRIRFVPGDYVEQEITGSFDAAWLSHVLHGEGPDTCRQMIRKCAGVLSPGGTLIVHEFILDDDLNGPLFPALFSLNMLLGTDAGQAYSEGQLREMMAAAGLTDIRRIPVDTPNDSGLIVGSVP